MEIQDNVSKAKELAFELPQCPMYIDNKCNQNFPCDRFKVALKMAQWKDEQYNEEKRDLLGLVKMLKIDEQNQTIIEDLVAILNS